MLITVLEDRFLIKQKMSRIDIVKQVTFYSDLTTSQGHWSQNLNIPFQADEIHVRQISYSGSGTEDGVFLIRSSLNNDFIGSFSVNSDVNITANAVSVNPRTIIKVSPNMIMNQADFTLYTIGGGSNLVSTDILTGTIIISCDFIRYKV